jgi:dihydrodipicolinate synthase/N-acetylneuraminate lyase
MCCLNAGAAIAKRNRGMIDKTELEIRAIKAARRNFAEALMELGLMGPFHSRSAEEIDRVIEACIDGFQDAMRRETLNDDLPF